MYYGVLGEKSINQDDTDLPVEETRDEVFVENRLGQTLIFPEERPGRGSLRRSSASSSSSAAFSFHRGGTDSLARELKSLSCRTSPAVSRRRSSGSTRAAKVDHQRERFPLRVARGKPVPICISVIPHRSHNRLHLEENTVLV